MTPFGLDTHLLLSLLPHLAESLLRMGTAGLQIPSLSGQHHLVLEAGAKGVPGVWALSDPDKALVSLALSTSKSLLFFQS